MIARLVTLCAIVMALASNVEAKAVPKTHHNAPIAKKPQTPVSSSSSYYKRNLNTIRQLYSLVNYPSSMAVIGGGAAALPKNLFNSKVTGRINPVGTFHGLQESIEYFYALSPLPAGNPAQAAVTKVKIHQFSSGCPNVAASTVYLTLDVINNNTDTGHVVSHIKQTGFWHFDASGSVDAYDLTIESLDEALNELGIFPTMPQVQAGTIQAVCGATMQSCTGTNAQYTSIEDCIQTLTAKPYGTYANAWSDTVVCRTIHSVLATIDPVHHCPHVGPTGGSKCVDMAYAAKYFDDSLFGSKKFVC